MEVTQSNPRKKDRRTKIYIVLSRKFQQGQLVGSAKLDIDTDGAIRLLLINAGGNSGDKGRDGLTDRAQLRTRDLVASTRESGRHGSGICVGANDVLQRKTVSQSHRKVHNTFQSNEVSKL